MIVKGQLSFRDRNALFNQIGVICCRSGRISLEGVEIYPIKSESGIKSLEPFIIINQGPVEISPHIDSFLYTFLERIDVASHEPYLPLHIMGCDAILCNDQGDLQC